MAKLAYYASLLPGKESQFQTPEGYRIYKDVPVARTGSQIYLGRELKANEGYQADWNLQDDQAYEVFRPLEEVTSRETIASFEAKSVLDEHPTDKVLVDALDEFEGITKGHGQNVRVGEPLSDGNIPLLADLVVKHPELNVKVDSGIREVSCGYSYVLAKDSSGRLIMTRIRGNHIAVVPRGRAGSEVAIGDALPEIPPPTNDETRKAPMSFSSRFFTALGFQNWAKDAKPEEVADALEEMKKGGEAKDADEHPEKCRCEDCMPDKSAKDKKAAKDAKSAKDAEEEAEKEAEEKAAADKAAKDAAEEEERKKKEEEEKSAKDEAEVLAPEDRGKSDFKVGDALALLENMRPAIAKSRIGAAVDSYNKLTEQMRKMRDGVKDGAVEDPFVSLVYVNSAAADAASQPEPSTLSFFSGKSYADGLKAFNEYQASKGAK